MYVVLVSRTNDHEKNKREKKKGLSNADEAQREILYRHTCTVRKVVPVQYHETYL